MSTSSTTLNLYMNNAFPPNFSLCPFGKCHTPTFYFSFSNDTASVASPRGKGSKHQSCFAWKLERIYEPAPGGGICFSCCCCGSSRSWCSSSALDASVPCRFHGVNHKAIPFVSFPPSCFNYIIIEG
jgi:hypothetical protein